MNKLRFLLVIAAVVAVALPVLAQRKRVSPHETITATVDGDKLTVIYGRPYSKDPKTGETRKIWGGLVPYGKVWRTGADEATLFMTEKTVVLGEKEIPAGTYSLFTLPEADGSAMLIVNKRTGQWGIPYVEAKEATNELARIPLNKSPLDKTVDQFTMAIENNSSGGGVLKMMWETAQYSVPFTVKK